MSKRSSTSKISYYENKIRKLKERSRKKHNRVIMYSSSSDSEENLDGTTQDEITARSPIMPVETEAVDTAPLPTAILVPDAEPEVPELQVIQVPEENPELDPELLLALGDPMDEQPAYGENIHQSLAQRWMPILKTGLNKDQKEKLLKEYQVPANCSLLKAPSLNPEVKAAISEITLNRDKNIQAKQDQLGIGITAVNKGITLLLLGGDKLQALKMLSDGCRVLTDLHYMETQVRTKLITPCLDKTFIPLIKDHERDEMLFGEKLSETIKASKAIERQGSQIKKPTPKPIPTPANAAGPSTSRTRFQGNEVRPLRYYSGNRGGRGGLPRTATPTSYRRVQAPPATTRSRSSHSSQRAHTRR